jgi:hypothetical protein
VSYVTDEMAWLMEELLKLEPGTQNGGLFAAKSGYHNTRNNHLRNRPGDYSIQDAVDREGPGDKAGAFDWTFPDAQAGRYATISRYMSRIIASGKDPDDPRLNGWREFYGQADGDREVEGWDSRYLVPVTSDSSHLWHIHGSVSRKYADDLDTMKALLSVIKGETVEQWVTGGGDMATAEEAIHKLQYEDNAWNVSTEPDDGVNLQSNQNRWSSAAHNAAKANENTEKILEQLGVGGTDPEVLRQVLTEVLDAQRVLFVDEVRALLIAQSQGELDALE